MSCRVDPGEGSRSLGAGSGETTGRGERSNERGLDPGGAGAQRSPRTHPQRGITAQVLTRWGTAMRAGAWLAWVKAGRGSQPAAAGR